jgi:hypothetical protein
MLFVFVAWAFMLNLTVCAQSGNHQSSFEILTRRMDVDGAPNAYGPPGTQTLDILYDPG